MMTNLSNQNSLCTDVSICYVNFKKISAEEKNLYRSSTYIYICNAYSYIAMRQHPASWLGSKLEGNLVSALSNAFLPSHTFQLSNPVFVQIDLS